MGILITSLAAERLLVWPALLVAVALFVGLAHRAGGSRRAILTFLLDVGIVCTYLWSLGDTLHITISVARTGYTADVGGNDAVVRVPAHPGGVALYAGGLHHYIVQPDGVAPMPPPDTPLRRLGDLARLAVPAPAWQSLHVSGTEFAPVPAARLAHDRNPRGEIQLDVRARVPVGRAAMLPFHLSADLVRPDGAQGVIVGLRNGRGYLLNVQMDQRYASWLSWNGRPGAAITAGQPISFRVHALPMVQRVARLVAASAILAILLAGLGVPIAGTVFQPRTEQSGVVRRSPLSGVAVLRRAPWHRCADAAAVALAASAAAGAGFIATTVFRGVPNVQDGVAYLFQARTLALGRLWLPIPSLSTFFQEEFILFYDHHWFGKYPPGWPVLLAAGVAVHHPELVNPVLLGCVVLILYGVARALYGRVVAVIAALLTATSPLLLVISGSYFAQTATLFYLLGGTALLCSWLTHGQLFGRFGSRLLIPAGVLYGMAAITRPLDAMAFAVPFVIAVILHDQRGMGWLMLGCAIPGALALAYNHAVTGFFFLNPYALVHPWDHLGFGPAVGGPGPYYAGFTPARAFWNLAYDLSMLQTGLFGWPYYVALALALVPFVLGRAGRWDVLLGSSVLAVFAAYLLYFDPGAWMGLPRYDFVVVPWIVVLAARGVVEMALLPSRLFGFQSHWRALAGFVWPAALLGVMFAYNGVVYLPAEIGTLQQWNAANLDAPRSVRQHGVRQALVFQVQNPTSDWWPYGGVFNDNAPFLNSGVIYARDEGASDCRLARHYPRWPLYRLDNKTLSPLPPCSVSHPHARSVATERISRTFPRVGRGHRAGTVSQVCPGRGRCSRQWPAGQMRPT